MGFKAGNFVVLTWDGPVNGMTTGRMYLVSRSGSVALAVVPDDFGYENWAKIACFSKPKKSKMPELLREFRSRVKNLKKSNVHSPGWEVYETAVKARQAEIKKAKLERLKAEQEAFRKMNAEPRDHGDGSRWDEI